MQILLIASLLLNVVLIAWLVRVRKIAKSRLQVEFLPHTLEALLQPPKKEWF